MAAQETGGPGTDSGRNVVGDGGHGHGVFQIDDRWHGFASTPAAMDPVKNADYAAGMLSDLVKRYGGNVRQALSAYNAGSPTATGTTTDWGDGKKIGYAESVLRHLARLSGGPQPPGEGAMASAATARANVASTSDAPGSASALDGFAQNMSRLQSLAAMAQAAAVAPSPTIAPSSANAHSVHTYANDAHLNDAIKSAQSKADNLTASLGGDDDGDTGDL